MRQLQAFTRTYRQLSTAPGGNADPPAGASSLPRFLARDASFLSSRAEEVPGTHAGHAGRGAEGARGVVGYGVRGKSGHLNCSHLHECRMHVAHSVEPRALDGARHCARVGRGRERRIDGWARRRYNHEYGVGALARGSWLIIRRNAVSSAPPTHTTPPHHHPPLLSSTSHPLPSLIL